MQTISVRRANELGNAARSAVESLLGRKVADEEHVTVMAYPVQPAAGEPDRKAAVRELIEVWTAWQPPPAISRKKRWMP